VETDISAARWAYIAVLKLLSTVCVCVCVCNESNCEKTGVHGLDVRFHAQITLEIAFGRKMPNVRRLESAILGLGFCWGKPVSARRLA